MVVHQQYVLTGGQYVPIGGPPGLDGERGSQWYLRSQYASPPAVPSPLKGDMFLWDVALTAGDVLGDLMQYGDAGWEPAGNIRGPQGEASGLEGPEGPPGEPGVGVPGGGATGQVLAKLSNTDFHTGWVPQTGGGSGLDQPTADLRYINTAGDTMTGNLVLNADPSTALGAATKQYVDSKAGSGGGLDQTTADARYVNATGDAMTGALTLSADPSNNLHAATKQYVDARSTGVPGYVTLDSYAGATDDDKLGNAMSYCAAQSYPPTILLGNRSHTFGVARTLYNGFSIQGVAGMGNAEKQSTGYRKTEVKAQVPGGVWLVHSGGEVWDVTVRNIAFTGQSTTQWMGGSSVYWCMNLRDCSWTGYQTILGSQTTKLLLNLCLFDGWLSFNNSYNGAIHIGGSDNALFLGMTNIDSATAYASAGNANGQYHLWLDYVSKSNIGGIYLTAEGAWNGIRVTGNDQNMPLWITGAKIEGRNAGAPCNGSLVRVEGGALTIRDSWLGYAMKNPTTPGHSPADAGVVHQTGGQVVLGGCTYDRATGVAESVPLLYQAGGVVHVNQTLVGTKGGTWTGKPVVQGVGGTRTVDSSVTVT